MTHRTKAPTACDAGLAPILQELAGLVMRAVPQDATVNLMGCVWASRSSALTAPTPTLYTPVLCVVAQGSKEVLLGEDRFVYDAAHCLLSTVTVPVSCAIIDATNERPFLSVSVLLDPALVRSVILDAGLHEPDTRRTLRGMESSKIDRALLDPVVRLARLFETPQDAPFLAALLLREIVYRMLTGAQGARLYQSAFASGQTHRVIDAIEWMRKNYDQPLHIDALARECGMSPSGLHHHFKSVTAMSPLRFQKQLRLQEARRLMIAEGMDAAGAGYKVGYDDSSYFNRDYKRFFGAPPFRDAIRLRDRVAQEGLTPLR